MSFGIYIHFPYCRSLCPYCNFNSHVVASIPHERYASAILAELELRVGQAGLLGREVDSVYFGGGTPGLWRPAEVGRVLDGLARRFALRAGAEVTAEVNPGSLDETALPGLRTAGVNRLSIGVQSLRDRHLHRLGRLHSAADAIATLNAARALGFASLSIDFMFGLPGQTLQEWREDLARIVDLEAPHISAYSLTVESETPLASWVARKQVELPGEDVETDQLLLAREVLCAAGYDHYEVSNYAWPGHRAVHNSLYWLGGEWLGLGAGAHGFLRESGLSGPSGPSVPSAQSVPPVGVGVAGYRWADVDDPEEYQRRALAGQAPEAWREVRSASEIAQEELFSGIRWLEGLDLAAFAARTGVDLRTAYAEVVAGLARDGMAEVVGGVLRLSERGLLYLNTVALRFFSADPDPSPAGESPSLADGPLVTLGRLSLDKREPTGIN